MLEAIPHAEELKRLLSQATPEDRAELLDMLNQVERRKMLILETT